MSSRIGAPLSGGVDAVAVSNTVSKVQKRAGGGGGAATTTEERTVVVDSKKSDKKKKSDTTSHHHEKEYTKEEKVHSNKITWNAKTIVGGLTALLVVILIVDSVMAPPDKRLIDPDFAKDFLRWVHDHPLRGLCAYVVVYAMTVICLVPGTPLTLGGGYVFKALYGWVAGITTATLASMLGSALGAVSCFLLGRYLMRDRVRQWSRKYPLFDAIDLAVSVHGFKIMAMLYLTPVLPLGPVSYMCGTTSMKLSAFIMAKIASMPLMLLFVFIGATTGTLVTEEEGGEGGNNSIGNSSSHHKSTDDWMEQHEQSMMIGGIILSAITIGVVSHFVKKELYTIIERQKRDGELNEKLEAGELEVAGAAASSSLSASTSDGTTTTTTAGNEIRDSSPWQRRSTTTQEEKKT